VTAAVGATIAKRSLSRRLRELREMTDLTANGVCDRLGWGRGKVGRIENNDWKRPEMSDIRDLLRFYHVGEEDARELERLGRLARERAWWRDYADVFGETEFPGLEADAERICCYAPLVLPGLLQTADYTEAQMSIGANPPVWRRKALQARQRRQLVLDREDDTAPQLVAVITEASLHYQWGTGGQRRSQLERLVELSGRPRAELRLLRYQDGFHAGMCGPINIFEYAGGEPPVVFLETDFAVHEVSARKDIESYIDTFANIQKYSLDGPATTAHLQQLATATP
jgi:transcriptional regulator with XRE-family HTH domain